MQAEHLELTQARDAVMVEMQTATVELRAVLDAEREALDQLDSMALDVATSTKADLLRRLESLDAERRHLDDAGAPPESPGAWQELLRQLEACRRINGVNGSIVEQQMLGVRRALGVLRGAGEAPPTLYGPGGRRHADNERHPISRA